MKAWKFTAEIAQDGGGLTVRVFYVKAPDVSSAFSTLKKEYPKQKSAG